jgi:mRNA interferase MazF
VKRGEIWYADLAQGHGHEASHVRPVVLVSRDAVNEAAHELGRGVVTVVPLTSATARIYPFELPCPAAQTGLPRDSKAQVEQIRAVDMRRLSERAGNLSPALAKELDRLLRQHLNL